MTIHPALLQGHIGHIVDRLQYFKNMLSESCKHDTSTPLAGIDIIRRKSVPECDNIICAGYREKGMDYIFYLASGPSDMVECYFPTINSRSTSFVSDLRKTIEEMNHILNVLGNITQDTEFEEFSFYMGHPHQYFNSYFNCDFIVESNLYKFSYSIENADLEEGGAQ